MIYVNAALQLFQCTAHGWKFVADLKLPISNKEARDVYCDCLNPLIIPPGNFFSFKEC